ncbi:MAG: metallophosphoesterase [Halanaerobiales bacterium]|nr:metallophosphoesterase [Halanaerobiales bacterium]
MRFKLLSGRAIIAIMVCILILMVWYFQRYSISVKRYTIVVPNLPTEFEGFTILHLSDLHSKEFGKNQSWLIKIINQENFDVIAVTGDLIDKRNPRIEPAVKLLQHLKSKQIFFVPGNHEWWVDFQSREELESLGINIMENSSYKLSKGNSHIWILGVDDPYLGRDRLDKALKNVDDSMPKILLAHAPNIFSSAVQNQINLVLVGHTHGGQIRIPFIGPIIAPGQGFFPKFDYGKFDSGFTSMIINGGLGESVLPIRFNIKPEVVLIKLVSEE